MRLALFYCSYENKDEKMRCPSNEPKHVLYFAKIMVQMWFSFDSTVVQHFRGDHEYATTRNPACVGVACKK